MELSHPPVPPAPGSEGQRVPGVSGTAGVGFPLADRMGFLLSEENLCFISVGPVRYGSLTHTVMKDGDP